MKFWFQKPTINKSFQTITPLMETPKVNIQELAIASAARVLAAYDRALAYIASLKQIISENDATIASLTQTILELTAMLDAKVSDTGGSVGGPELANA